MSRSIFLVALLVASPCLTLLQAPATTAVYLTAARRWFSSSGINDPIQQGDILQYSHCQSDGWTSASDACVRRHFDDWNGVSEYYITDGTNQLISHVDWGVGNVGDPEYLTFAYTVTNTNGATYTDQQGRQVVEIISAYVVFDESRRWRDEYDNLQPAVRNYNGDPSYYRIDYVTVHEAGHIWGCTGHSSSTGDVMYGSYPHNYGSLSQNDIDTIRDLYNVRQFH
ncbi:MAG: matrixin family metalloprotease [Armatimonadota bacterium]